MPGTVLMATTSHSGCTVHATDPVCGMSVDPKTAKHRFAHNGQNYLFCCGRCRERFEAEPEKFLKPKQPEPAAAPGSIYTCPMHPEVKQTGPGACPICGMALEPEQISLDDKPDPELIDMTRRFRIALALTIPVFAIEMGGHLGLMHLVPQNLLNWISFALSTPVVLWAGAPFFARGWRSLVTRNLNMFTLIAMGTGVAWAYSVVATLAPQLFPPTFRDMHGEVAVYFEAAAVITVLVLLGQVLELARQRKDLRRDPRVAWSSAENRPAHRRTRRRRRGAGLDRGRRSAAGAPRREDSGRWRRRAGPLVGRRIDGDR